MLQAYVSIVLDVSEVCFRGLLQIDWDVACCKGLLPMFHLCFQTYVASVFIWMLHIFHTYVTYVLSGCCICLHWFQVFSGVYFQAFQNHVSSVSSAFRCTLLLLHLDVLKIDRVLHLSPLPSAASPQCLLLPALVGHRLPPLPLLDAGDI
jgi:hypothetical protein